MSEAILYRGHEIPIQWARATYTNIGKGETEVQDWIKREKHFIDNLVRRTENGGYKLKFYFLEKQAFGVEYSVHFEDHIAEQICKKIARHFKFKLRLVQFRGNHQRGYAWYDEARIRLAHNPSLALICHELAHIHNKQKIGNGHHNKKLFQTMSKFIKYSKTVKVREQ